METRVKTSRVQELRWVVEQRLTAAAEEIFGLFERTIAEYQEELCRSKEEIERQRKLLNAVFNPQVRLRSADVQQLVESKEEVSSERQDWTSLDQDPEPPHIKEEEQGQWSSQEAEQFPVKSEDDEERGEDCEGPEPDSDSDPDGDLGAGSENRMSDSSEPETDDSGDWREAGEAKSGGNCDKKRFSCSVCAKSFTRHQNLTSHMTYHSGENLFGSVWAKSCFVLQQLQTHMTVHTEEKPPSSQRLQSHSEDSRVSDRGEDCGGPEPDKNAGPDGHSGSSETEARDSEDLKSQDQRTFRGKPFSCCFCGKKFAHKAGAVSHMGCHTGENPFRCSVCSKRFSLKGRALNHLRHHAGKDPFSCSICKKRFRSRASVTKHLDVHIDMNVSDATGIKIVGKSEQGDKLHPGLFSCSVCGWEFSRKANLCRHMRRHTVEKPFVCSVCEKPFRHCESLKRHIKLHTRQKTSFSDEES